MHHQYQQYQAPQGQDHSGFAQPPFHQQSSAFSRYGAPSPYGGQQQYQQQPQQAEESQQAAPSPYQTFKQPETVSSPYFQQPVASHSPAPVAQQQQAPAAQSPYAAFNSIPQQQQQSQAPFGSSATDYSSLYGQDSMRNMVNYDYLLFLR